MKLEHEIKVGGFILLSIALLTYLILWLHKFDMSSYLNLTARFKDVGTLGIGSNVLYRGVKAGTVNDIVISNDGNFALVKISISNKDIKIYEGSTASVVDKSFTGTKALIITPPKKTNGKLFLKEDAVIEGTSSFNFEELQKLLTRLSNEGKLNSMIDDTHQLVKNTNNLSNKMESLLSKTEVLLSEENSERLTVFLDEATSLSNDLQVTSKNLNKIIGDNKIQKNIKETVESTNEAMKNFTEVVNKTDKLVDKSDKVVNDIDKTISKIDDTVNNTELHGSIRESMGKMSDILSDIRNITGDKEIQNNLKSFIDESSESVSNLNCVSTELSNTLSKRFLLPRLMLGCPGKNLTKCKQYQQEITPKANKSEK